MCSSSMATCCWMVSTAGGSSPSIPSCRRSALREGDVFVLGRVAENLLAARPADVEGWLWFHGLEC